MRVLHVLNELRPSGAEVMLRVAAESWRRQGITGEILCTGETEGEYADVLRQAGYHVYHLPFVRSVRFLIAVYLFLRSGGYDVIHLHTERAGFWYAAVAFAAGQRRIIRTIHSLFPFRGVLRVRRGCQRWLMRQVFGVRMAACGETAARVEWETYRNPVEVLGNWFDSEVFRPVARVEKEPGAPFVIATVGNCCEVKNHEAVLRALVDLPGVVYLHAGCEDAGAREQELAGELGVAGRVRFLGMMTDVRSVLRAADLFVMPSRYEGLGNAALEAMGAGVPVLLADSVGLRDFRALSSAIRYCEPEPAALREAVRTFMALPAAERAAAGAAVSEMAHRQFGVAAGAARYAAVYRGEALPSAARAVTA